MAWCMNAIELKKRELELLKRKLKLKTELPHIHGFPWYKWAREFFESSNRMCFLTAGNQLSKSSTQIRKCIHWATDVSLWPKLWPTAITKPNVFWYFYPTADLATEEFELKWSLFLPQGDMQKDPVYGWKAHYKNSKIDAITFNSGVTVIFKTYSQSVTDIQTGTVYSIFCFDKDTEVITARGPLSISDVVPGDIVWTNNNWGTVGSIAERESPRLQISFSNGTQIITSPEHPFFTNDGWVQAKDLHKGQECFKRSAWEEFSVLQTWFYLKAIFIPDIPIQRTLGKKIIGEATRLGNLCTLLFGKRITVGQCLKGLSSTTLTLTLWTIIFLIFNALHAVNTLLYTKSMSGVRQNIKSLFAASAGKIFYRALPSATFLGFALVSVASLLKKPFAKFAKKLLMRVKTRTKNIVVSRVELSPGTVHNISLDKSTYFANNILVHNCDEEVPMSHWPEIQSRLNATDGYLSMVFTATLGQEHWRKTIEGKGSGELYPTADKWQVTLFDCLQYEDGTPSPWAFEKSRRAVARACSDPANQAAVEACEDLEALKKLAMTVPDTEVQRRILGKFVLAGGRKFESFRREWNVCEKHPIPSNWLWFGGADYGGGGSGHPSACVFLAVSPDYTVARVVKGRRADGIVTTAKDLLDIYREVRGNTQMTLQVYDYHCKDFHTFATRAGESFVRAEKDQNWGTATLNTLFKIRALQIFDDDVELEKLITELVSLQYETAKNMAADDFADALRYAVMAVPWNWAMLDEKEIDLELRKKEPVKKVIPTPEDERRDFALGRSRDDDFDYSSEHELEDWDNLINEFDS